MLDTLQPAQLIAWHADLHFIGVYLENAPHKVLADKHALLVGSIAWGFAHNIIPQTYYRQNLDELSFAFKQLVPDNKQVRWAPGL